MSKSANELAGRLPLIGAAQLTAAQRNLYERLDAVATPWAERTGFQAKTAQGAFIGPFNAMFFSPEIAEAFWALQLEEEKHTTLSERTRQVVILSIGSLWKSDYELYAHSAVARKAGFSNEAVRALAAGLPSPELSDQERIAQRFTLTLAADRRVDDELYRAAAGCFGEHGLVDMIVLAGCYHLVCSVLNAFEAPAPGAGRP